MTRGEWGGRREEGCARSWVVSGHWQFGFSREAEWPVADNSIRCDPSPIPAQPSPAQPSPAQPSPALTIIRGEGGGEGEGVSAVNCSFCSRPQHRRRAPGPADTRHHGHHTLVTCLHRDLGGQEIPSPSGDRDQVAR